MKMTSRIFTLVALLWAAPALAAEKVELIIGSGSEGGTYYPVVEQMAKFCSSGTLGIKHRMKGDKSFGGSMNNIRGLLNNVIMAGIVQGDTAYLEKQTVPAMGRVMALLPLHQEAIHYIVPVRVNVMVKAAEEGYLGTSVGAKAAVYEVQNNPVNTLSQLRGKRIATWGGSLTSAKVIEQLVGLGNVLTKVSNREEAMGLLDSGQVDAVVATVGYPAKWIEDLPAKKYKLLDVSQATQKMVAHVYGVTGVSYDNFGNGGQQAKALSVSSILFTRKYRTPKMINALAELQRCVRTKIFEIQDTPGTHPAWQAIDPSADMLWDNVFKAPAISE